MHQVQLNDELFKEAQRRAKAAGFATVDEYVADVLGHDLMAENGEPTPDLDHLFTPERIALIDNGVAQIKAGLGHSAEQAEAELAKRRGEWIQKHAG